MQDNPKLKVVLYWHMHQPDYRDIPTGTYQQPWTYLHTIKDYIDMAMHLELNPKAKVVVNFTPILLEQIDDYANQIYAFLNHQQPIRDPLLNALTETSIPANTFHRMDILRWCSKAHDKNVIQRFPAFSRLIDINTKLKDCIDDIIYLSEQYFFDLLVWYHLGWLGELVRRSDLRIKRLIKKEHSYDRNDRKELLTVIYELISSTIPKYRKLAKTNQIELSTTPYAHPIIPLLNNFNCALETMPDAPLPSYENYPGGSERAIWHIEKGLEVFKKHFGFTPSGCWPSEGAISERACKQLDAQGFRWVASGAGVFWNCVNNSNENTHTNIYEHFANHVENQNIICFFRDDRLSDLIGFEYATWHADDAVANLVQNLTEIANQDPRTPQKIISIILDGENAWEHYPENGFYFLSALYKHLSNHSDLELVTYSEYLDEISPQPQVLPKLVAGSWIYGTLSTWIGENDKNRAWDMLCDAKICFDNVINKKSFTKDELNLIYKQLAVCEGSDWFWWFGDYNSAESVSDFDKLFRKNLFNLYELLGETPPDYLGKSFTYGNDVPVEGGSMRRSSESS